MNYTTSCQYSIRLLKKLRLLDTTDTLDFSIIEKAIYWAKKYHDGQFRKSGKPFYTHPLEVAYMVSDYNLKTDVIVTSILHDIVEDTQVTVGMIVDGFSWRIAEMVDRLTRDRPDGTKLSVEKILDNAYDEDDKEVLLIKVIDRLHNMQTISWMSIDKQDTQVIETLREFIILVEELSLEKVSKEMFKFCSTVKSLANKNVTDNVLSVFDKTSIMPVLFYQSDLPPNKILDLSE